MCQCPIFLTFNSIQDQQDENEIFLARLSPEELEKSGFDASDFTPYGYVDVYLQFWNGEYRLKYRFDSDATTDYYEKPQDVGGMQNFIDIVATYLHFQKTQQNDEQEEIGHATIELIQAHPFGPNEGTVYIYKVTPIPIPHGMQIEEFFIATFSDDNTEISWGLGGDPKEALSMASMKWEKEVGDELGENPFEKVLSEITNQEGE